MRSESTDWLLFKFPAEVVSDNIRLEYVIDWRQPIDYVYRASAYSDWANQKKEIRKYENLIEIQTSGF